MENIYLPQPQQRRTLKVLLILTTLLLSILFVFFWVYSHAFIKVSVDNLGNGDTTIKLINQASGHETTINKASLPFKQLVGRGSYEVLVTQNETSYYSLIQTGGFLSATTASGKLEIEKSRSFVGNNPNPCMYYAGATLLSRACDGNLSDIVEHLPADAKTPPITQTSGAAPNSPVVYALFRLGDQNVVILNDSGYAAYQLQAGIKLTNYTRLPDLRAENEYSFQPYQEGFLAYALVSGDIRYYKSLATAPTTISISAPKDEGLSAFALSTSGKHIAIGYSNSLAGQDPENIKSATKDSKTVVQIYEDGKAKSFEFRGVYSKMNLCGDKYLCLVSAKQLSVFDIRGEKAIKLFAINNVSAIESGQSGLVVIKDDSVIGIDIAKRIGSIQYSFGSYKYCGDSQAQNGGYVLCVINPKNNRVALLVDPAQNNVDSIDKKVLSMLDQPFIETVSAYKSFIYVSPNLGSLVYDPATKGYTYSPAIKQKAAADINSLVGRLGIDKSRYTVINTQP